MANTETVTGRSRRYKAVDLAIAAEREARCDRREALGFATALGGSPEEVVARAEAYFAFLRAED